jgi:F-type H+-transporting ATPase subunit b
VLIDWFTVIAQIVNFLILVVLMKRYLWGPLVRGIDEREKRITDSLADADRRSRDAAERVKTLEAEKADLEQRCSLMLNDARESAEAKRNQLIEEARANIHAMEKKWMAELERERTTFLDELRRKGAAEILAITRSALRDLAGADLQSSALQMFLSKLASLDPASLRTMATSEVTVVTPGDLSPAARAQIASAMENRFGSPVPLIFQTASSLAWGVEMRGGGLKIGWTSDTYLDALEQKLREVLEHLIASTPPLLPEELVHEDSTHEDPAHEGAAPVESFGVSVAG